MKKLLYSLLRFDIERKLEKCSVPFRYDVLGVLGYRPRNIYFDISYGFVREMTSTEEDLRIAKKEIDGLNYEIYRLKEVTESLKNTTDIQKSPKEKTTIKVHVNGMGKYEVWKNTEHQGKDKCHPEYTRVWMQNEISGTFDDASDAVLFANALGKEMIKTKSNKKK